MSIDGREYEVKTNKNGEHFAVPVGLKEGEFVVPLRLPWLDDLSR